MPLPTRRPAWFRWTRASPSTGQPIDGREGKFPGGLSGGNARRETQARCRSVGIGPAIVGSVAVALIGQASAAAPPDLRAMPPAAAPGELGSVVLPESARAVSALIARLPPAVAGHQRTVALRPGITGSVVVGYGEDRRRPDVPGAVLRLQVIDLRNGDFFPTNWSGGDVVGFMAQTKPGIDAGREGDLLWMRDQSTIALPGSPEQTVVYGLAWGRIGSPWLFSVEGDTSGSRDALLWRSWPLQSPPASSARGTDTVTSTIHSSVAMSRTIA